MPAVTLCSNPSTAQVDSVGPGGDPVELAARWRGDRAQGSELRVVDLGHRSRGVVVQGPGQTVHATLEFVPSPVQGWQISSITHC
jgi:hypothetical protein